MKYTILIFAATTAITLASCEAKKEETISQDLLELKQEVQHLEVKLKATEAQLLNVDAELSSLKSQLANDSLSSK